MFPICTSKELYFDLNCLVCFIRNTLQVSAVTARSMTCLKTGPYLDCVENCTVFRNRWENLRRLNNPRNRQSNLLCPPYLPSPQHMQGRQQSWFSYPHILLSYLHPPLLLIVYLTWTHLSSDFCLFRLVQKAELTRLSQTFLHVPHFHWIVVEDSLHKTPLVTDLLLKSGLTYTHLHVPTAKDRKLHEVSRCQGLRRQNQFFLFLFCYFEVKCTF